MKGNHKDKRIWTPRISEILSTEIEPGNLVDKCAIYVKKKLNSWISTTWKRWEVCENYVLFFGEQKTMVSAMF